jgi:hypothetical protein
MAVSGIEDASRQSSNPFTHQACIIAHYKFWQADSPATPEVDESTTPKGFHLKGSGNDPSAGSPTDTLLRLLLPLNNQVWRSSVSPQTLRSPGLPPKASLNHSIGSSDGRCVQRAGT